MLSVVSEFLLHFHLDFGGPDIPDFDMLGSYECLRPGHPGKLKSGRLRVVPDRSGLICLENAQICGMSKISDSGSVRFRTLRTQGTKFLKSTSKMNRGNLIWQIFTVAISRYLRGEAKFCKSNIAPKFTLPDIRKRSPDVRI